MSATARIQGNQPAQGSAATNPLREAHKERILRELNEVETVIANWQAEHPEDRLTNALKIWLEGFKNSLGESLNLGQVEGLFVEELQNMICPDQNADGHARAFPIDENPIFDTRSQQTYGAKAYVFYLLGSTAENRQIGLQLVDWIQNRGTQEVPIELPFRAHPVVKHMVSFLEKRNAFFYPEGIDEAYQNALAGPAPRQRDLNAILSRLLSQDRSDTSVDGSLSDEGLSSVGSDDEDNMPELADLSLQREQVDSARRTALMMQQVNTNAAQIAEDARRNATRRTFQNLSQGLLAAFDASDRTSNVALTSLVEGTAAVEDLEETVDAGSQADLAALAARVNQLDANIQRAEEDEQRLQQEALQRLGQEREEIERNLELAANGNREAIAAVQDAIVRIVRPNVVRNLQVLNERDRRIEGRLNQIAENAAARAAVFEERIRQVAQRAQALQTRITTYAYAVQQLDGMVEGTKKDVEVLRKNIEATRQAVEELKERRENNTWKMVAQIGICIVATVALNYMIEPLVVIFPTGDGGFAAIGHV